MALETTKQSSRYTSDPEIAHIVPLSYPHPSPNFRRGSPRSPKRRRKTRLALEKEPPAAPPSGCGLAFLAAYRVALDAIVPRNIPDIPRNRVAPASTAPRSDWAWGAVEDGVGVQRLVRTAAGMLEAGRSCFLAPEAKH